jgi:hypothetical protein
MPLRRNRRVMTTVCVVAVSSHSVTGRSAEGRVMTSEALWLVRQRPGYASHFSGRIFYYNLPFLLYVPA